MNRRAPSTRARIRIGLLCTAVVLVLIAYIAVQSERAEDTRELSLGARVQRTLFPLAPRNHDRVVRGAQVTGSVLTIAGRAISGARVCAACASCSLTTADGARCALSDANGAFALEVDSGAALVLSAQAKGFVTGYAHQGEPFYLTAGTHQACEIRLKEGGENIAGTVIDALGGPVAQARIKLVRYVDALTPTLEVLADEEGKFSATVPEGSVTLRAEAEGYAPSSVTYVAPSHNIILALMPESTVRGTVVEAGTGKRVAGVSILAHPENAAPRHPQTSSDESGEFEIRGLDPGRYLFVAEGDQHRGETRRAVEVGLAERIVDVQIEVQPAALIIGQVELSSSGQPCPQGRALLGPEGPLTIPVASEQAGDADVITVASPIEHDGSVRFRGVPAGRYHVMVQCLHHVYESGPALVDASKVTAPLLWKVRPGGGLRVHVISHTGSPVANAKLSLEFPELKGRRALMPLVADQRGEATTTRNYRAGTYRVHPDPSYGAPPVSVEIPAKGGFIELTLTLPGSGEVVVSVKSEAGQPLDDVRVLATRAASSPTTAPPGAQASAVQGPAPEASAAVGLLALPSNAGPLRMMAAGLGDGLYRLGPLVPATYQIEVQDGDNPPVIVAPALSLRASQRTELTAFVSRGGTIHGKVVDEQGNPTANAWVKAEYQGRPPSSRLDNLGRESHGVGLTRVLSDEEGNFQLEQLAKSAIYDLRAEKHHGGVAVQREVREGSSVSLKLPSPGELRGVVVDETGRPSTVYEISASLLSAPEAMRSLQVVSREGRFHLEGVPAGRVQVQAIARGGQTAQQFVDLAPNQQLDGLRLAFLARRPELEVSQADAEPSRAKDKSAPVAPVEAQGSASEQDKAEAREPAKEPAEPSKPTREDERKAMEGA